MGQSTSELMKNFSDDVKILNADLMAHLGLDIMGNRLAIADRINNLPDKRGNKYNARKILDGDKKFDSQAEYRHWLILRAQEDNGEISDLTHQYKVILLESFDYRGERVQQIAYTADFAFVKDGILHIQDTKSIATAKTEAFRIRWRLLQWLYRDRDDIICEIIFP